MTAAKVAQRTPGPWAADGINPTFVYRNPSDPHNADGFNVGNDADAAFIVRACNSHDDLLAALREIVAIDDGDVPALYGFEPIFNRARAAIARAEG